MLNCWDQICQICQDTINGTINQVLKILTMVIKAYDGRAERWLNWNVYDTSVKCEF